MENHQTDIVYRYTPSIAPAIFKLIWIIPILLTPAGLLIYFIEDKSIPRLIATIGSGFGIYILLYGLLWWVNKFIAQRTGLTISNTGTMEIILNKKKESYLLPDIKSISLQTRVPGLIPIIIQYNNGETTTTRLPGTLTRKDFTELSQALEMFDVEIVWKP